MKRWEIAFSCILFCMCMVVYADDVNPVAIMKTEKNPFVAEKNPASVAFVQIKSGEKQTRKPEKFDKVGSREVKIIVLNPSLFPDVSLNMQRTGEKMNDTFTQKYKLHIVKPDPSKKYAMNLVKPDPRHQYTMGINPLQPTAIWPPKKDQDDNK